MEAYIIGRKKLLTGEKFCAKMLKLKFGKIPKQKE